MRTEISAILKYIRLYLSNLYIYMVRSRAYIRLYGSAKHIDYTTRMWALNTATETLSLQP
jgi:isoleucyl-tRNA synthetase